MSAKNIFVINNGSTSCKIALFEDKKLKVQEELFIDSDSIRGMKLVIDQLDMRTALVKDFLEKENIDSSTFDIIVTRGGTIPPSKAGAYAVNALMLNTLRYAPMAQHASWLSCMIGMELARPFRTPVIIYDAPGSDEFDPKAKITGLPEVTIVPVSHVLNIRKVAREVAERLKLPYEDGNFIVAHLGGGISINIHKQGRIVDSVYDDMGPMSPQRAGRIPTRFMTKLCYSGKFTEAEMKRHQAGEGGLTAWFGTQDLRKIEKLIDDGNETAKLVYEAMTYQIAKGIGELAPVVNGKIDAVILTGGCAWSEKFTKQIAESAHVLEGVFDSAGHGIVYPVLIGDSLEIKALMNRLGYSNELCRIVDCPDDKQQSEKAVELINSGEGDFLMKGLVETIDFLKSVVNKSNNLTTGQVMSHRAFGEFPGYPKFLGLSDGVKQEDLTDVNW